jgi:hypothetical protein
MNNDRTLPAESAIFAINMLVGTEEDDCLKALNFPRLYAFQPSWNDPYNTTSK